MNLRPKIMISRCLGFENCRYDGNIIQFDILQHLQKYIDFIEICPEYDIKLGIPRYPLKLVQKNDLHLIQSSTKKDITDSMNSYTDKLILKMHYINGIIIKSKSPSCGIKTVKIYSSEYEQKLLHNYGTGLFIERFLQHYSYLPFIDEINIKNDDMQDNYFVSVFLYTDFKNHCDTLTQLFQFHKRNKLLLMSFNKNIQKKLDSILINNQNMNELYIIKKYTCMFKTVLLHSPSRNKYVDIFIYIVDLLSNILNTSEIKSLFENIYIYYIGNISILNLRNIFNQYILKYKLDYLTNQSIFSPYPYNLFNNRGI